MILAALAGVACLEPWSQPEASNPYLGDVPELTAVVAALTERRERISGLHWISRLDNTRAEEGEPDWLYTEAVLDMPSRFELRQWHGTDVDRFDVRTQAWRFQAGGAIRYLPSVRSFAHRDGSVLPAAVSMELPLLWLGVWPDACGVAAPRFLESQIDPVTEIHRAPGDWVPKVLANGDVRLSTRSGASITMAPALGWAVRERFQNHPSGRGARLAASEFEELQGVWYPRRLHLTISQEQEPAPVFEMEVEVLLWEVDPAPILVPEPEEVPGAYDTTSNDSAEWRQLTPGGIDLLTAMTQDLSTRFPTVDASEGPRRRTLSIWGPAILLLVLAQQLGTGARRSPEG